jgi:hypothetical protein
VVAHFVCWCVGVLVWILVAVAVLDEIEGDGVEMGFIET